MEQNQLDKGLKKAMKIKESPRLSTNFTFRTMLKVQEAIRLKELKQEKQMFWATVAASVFLLVGGGVVIACFWGDAFLEMVTNVFVAFARLDILSSPYAFLSLAVLLLLGFDYWMRRAYFKRHSKE
jgi:hypothetical protein